MITGLPVGVAPAPGSVGRLLPFTDVKIVSSQGVCDNPDIGQPAKGELLVRGPQLFREYLANEEATADAFDEDGYFRSAPNARRFRRSGS